MADDKLIFPIGFDLEEGVAKVEKDWGKMQKRLQDTFKSQTIQVDADISKAVLDKLYAKFEGLIKTMESKAPQIKLKMPDTVDFEQEINRLKVQLKSINLGELTDAESKDLYLYIRQLEALAKALKEVNKQEQLRQANNTANKALQEARAQEKLTRAKANDALAEQRRAKIATETARQNEINNRSAQRGAVIAEQKRAATARAEQAELRLTQAKQRSAEATQKQNTAYAQQSTYLQRLAQRMIAYASVSQVFSFLRNIREVTAQFELQRVALGSIIGDLNKANAMFEQIKVAAVKSPFQIKELVTYTKQLAAYKIETDELFETTQRLADVSAGLGVGMERLVLAYGQIRATGYLRASEVRQLTEAGIPIVEELAKKMSELRGETVSAAEVMGLISERAISFGMVKEVFDDMTSAGGMFYKMQEKQAETLAGQWSNLQDSIAIMYEEIGNTDGVNNAMKGMIGLIKSLAENWRVVGDVASWSIGFALGYAKIIKPLGAMLEKQRQLNMAFEAYQRARLAYGHYQRTGIESFRQEAEAQVRLARGYRQSANALSGFGGALKSIVSFVKANWIGILLTAVTTLAAYLASARREAKRLNEELDKIGAKGALQIDQQARNFEYLAKTIRESADGSEKQTAALAELKRSYGELLPSQDKEIRALVQEKSNYDALIEAIREKINLQMHEQKLNTIASEYGGRISKQESKLQKTLSKIGLSPAEIGRIFETVKQKVQEGATLGIEDFAKILTDKTTLAFERVGNTTVVSAGLFKGVDVRDFEKYIETLGEYNEQIELVGGSLDHLDDKGKNLSDTFNTWQKELSAITKGKNLKGEGIRVFDDESITQINKLTDATARVAEEYDRLAKEKKELDKALKSEGAKADKDTYATLQERLGKIKEGMSGLYSFLKKYGALDLIKSDDKTKKSAEQALKDELSTVEKIYKRYADLRKFKSESDTQSMLAEEFKGVDLKILKKAYSPEQMLAVYEKALAEAQRLGKEDLVLEIQAKIGDLKVDEEQRKLEKKLKGLSDQISRTKTAKEFFDRMLGLTGDKQLSASLTLSVYGEGGDLGKKLAEETIKEAELAFAGLDISKAIDKNTGSINYALLRTMLPALKDISEEQAKTAEKFVSNGEKANADWLIDLQKTYQKALSFEERRTQVMNEEAQKRKEIAESVLPPTQKEQFKKASEKREKERIASINLEEFKESEDWVQTFENIEKVGTRSIKHLLMVLREFIDTNKKDLTSEQLRTLMNEYEKLYQTLIERNPIKAMTDGTTEYFKALKEVRQVKNSQDLTNAKAKEEEAKGEVIQAKVELRGVKGTSQETAAKTKLADAEKKLVAAQKERAKVETTLRKAQDKQRTALSKVQGGLANTINGYNEMKSVIESVSDTFGVDETSDLGVALNSVSQALTVIVGVLGAINAMITLIETHPLVLALSAAIMAIIGAIMLFNNLATRDAEREIAKQAKLLEDLQYAYERLEKAQEKAFSTEYISNYQSRLDNLQAQLEAYNKQIDAEQSKGKKADEDKIKDLGESVRETSDAIKDMANEMSEYFLGTDLTSAARDFANAWIDAYKEFGSTTEAIGEKFQEMIQNMVVESFAAKVMQQALQPIFDEIDLMTKDGTLDMSEAERVASMSKDAIANIDVGMSNLMSALEASGISVRNMGGDFTGISRDIASASEESILGLSAGINTQNFYISQIPTKLDVIISIMRGGEMTQGSSMTMQDLFTMQNQHLSHLPNIAQHTADTVAECKAIVAATQRTADALERVIKPNGTPSNYKLNTTLS